MAGPEELRPSVEQNVEVSKAAAERLEALSEKKAEKSIESQEKSEAKAKHEAMEQAVSIEASSAEKEKKQPAQSTRRHGAISKKEKDASFKKQMTRVQSELPPAQRAFSKFIHNKSVEKASDTIGSTVARPDAILSGAVAAFILVLLVYVIAKTFGYVLSGFETIGAFIIGWILGIIYDYLKTIITGKTS
jgi:cobalamin biosynthesis Mg chelatase CobN